MRGLLPDDYRQRHATAPHLVPWHSGMTSLSTVHCILARQYLNSHSSRMSSNGLLGKYALCIASLNHSGAAQHVALPMSFCVDA